MDQTQKEKNAKEKNREFTNKLVRKKANGQTMYVFPKIKECKKQLRKAGHEFINQNIFESLNNKDTKPFRKFIEFKRQE